MKPKEGACMLATNSLECEISPWEFVQDLVVLVVEGRIPELSEHGRKEGIHCWPVTYNSTKDCCPQSRNADDSCNLVADIRDRVMVLLNKHQSLVVEVFASLDDSKDHQPGHSAIMANDKRVTLNHFQEGIQYVIVEKWKIDLEQHSHVSGKGRLISMQFLLQAVRSFLHFSQLSAWLISSYGVSPKYISYKISETTEPSSMPFVKPEEIHVFPLTDISKENVAKVTVFSLPRISCESILEGNLLQALGSQTISLPLGKCANAPKDQPTSDAESKQSAGECSLAACARQHQEQYDAQSQKQASNHDDGHMEYSSAYMGAVFEHHLPSDGECLDSKNRTTCFNGCHYSNGNDSSYCVKKENNKHCSASAHNLCRKFENEVKNIDQYNSENCSEDEVSWTAYCRGSTRGSENHPLSHQMTSSPREDLSATLEGCLKMEEKKYVCSNRIASENVEDKFEKNCHRDCMAFDQFCRDLKEFNAELTRSMEFLNIKKEQPFVNSDKKENFYPCHVAYFQGEIDHSDIRGAKHQVLRPKNLLACSSDDEMMKAQKNLDRGSLLSKLLEPNFANDKMSACNCSATREKFHGRSKSASAQMMTEKTPKPLDRPRPKSSFPRLSLGACTVPVFHKKTNLPINSSPAPLRRPESQGWNINGRRDLEPDSELSDEYSSPHLLSKSAPASTSLLGNFEESMLKGRMPAVGRVEGFSIVLGASGSFCPRQIILPVKAHFFSLSDDDAPSPYLGYVRLRDSLVGRKGYHVPKHGTIQVTLFNPHKTVVKVFVVIYNFDDMPCNSQTFLRQRIVSLKTDSEEDEAFQQSLHYLIHLRFRCSKHGRLYVHTDIRVIFPQQTPDLDPGCRLRTLTDGPTDPKYTPLNR